MIPMRYETALKHTGSNVLLEINASLILVSCSCIVSGCLHSLHKTNCVERNNTMQYVHGAVCNDENSTTAGSRLVHTEPWCAGACNTHIHPIESMSHTIHLLNDDLTGLETIKCLGDDCEANICLIIVEKCV